MAVRIRLKKMGRRHQTFFRVCAMDQRTPRNGRVLEELGTYDPKVPDVDARAILKGERIAYWLSVGAQPSDKVRVLIKKYGPQGTHLEKQKAAVEKRRAPREIPPPEPPPASPVPQEPPREEIALPAEGASAETASAESTSAEPSSTETAPAETGSGEPAASGEPTGSPAAGESPGPSGEETNKEE